MQHYNYLLKQLKQYNYLRRQANLARDMTLMAKDAPNTGCRSISCSCGGWPSRGFGMAPGGYGKRVRCGPAARGSTRGWAPEPGGHTRHSPPPTPCQQQFVRVQSQNYNIVKVQTQVHAHHAAMFKNQARLQSSQTQAKHRCYCMHAHMPHQKYRKYFIKCS